MAKITLKGFNAYIRWIQVQQLYSRRLCKAVVYAGVKVVADAIRREVDALPAISDEAALANYRMSKDRNLMPYLCELQKKGLQESLGVAPIENKSGFIQTSVGFAGYNAIKTKRWPKGQPNIMVARSLERGTSFLERDRFVERAVKFARKEAIAAMQAEADAYIEKKMQENGG